MGSFVEYDTLCHHGVLGMKWGVRRYQNKDGSLTEAGKKRYSHEMRSNTRATIGKGQMLYRTQRGSGNEIAENGRLYVAPSQSQGTHYAAKVIGPNNLMKYGEAYISRYKNKKVIEIPSAKEQEKLEIRALTNEAARKDVIDSLVRKGFSDKEAIKYSDPKLNQKMTTAAWLKTVASLPLYITPSLGVYADVKIWSKRNTAVNDQKRYVRNVQGDQKAVGYNKEFDRSLEKRGYNAFRDFNDTKRGISKEAIVLINANKNVDLVDARKLDKKTFVDLAMQAHKETLPKKQRNLVSEETKKKFEADYDRYINAYADSIIQERAKAKRDVERQKVLNEAKEKKKEE